MKNQYITYLFKNIEEKKLVYKMLFSLGYSHLNGKSLEEIYKSIDEDNTNSGSGMHLSLSTKDKIIRGSYTHKHLAYEHLSFDSIGTLINHVIKELNTFSEDIVLNASYTATVKKEAVTVGCQTFSHEAVKKLYESSVRAQAS